MISVIICSVNPVLLSNLRFNIAATIGCPFEILAFDNRQEKKGIAAVYNQLAAKAAFDLLCFVHEDVIIHSNGWGSVIKRILADTEIGLVGVSGAVYKSRYPGSWAACHQSLYRIHSIQHFTKGADPEIININPGNTSTAEVAVIDGVFMATTKEIFNRHKFDEGLLQGFHGYDMDFSLQVGQQHQLVVTYELLLEHLSAGNFDKSWMTGSLKVHHKWAHRLPKNVAGNDGFQCLSDYIACSSVLGSLIETRYNRLTIIKYYLKLVFIFFRENKFRYTKTVLRYFFGLR